MKKNQFLAKIIVVVVLLCATFAARSESKKTMCISLGYNCEVASQLAKVHLRHNALPFDWVVSPNFTTICELIENGFKGFFDRGNLQFKYEDKNGHQHYMHNTLGLHFFHEFSREYPLEKNYQDVKNKYDRRIKRFYEILSSQDRVIFFRTYAGTMSGLNKNEAQHFCTLIEKMFPNLDFTLVALSNTDKDISWDLPRVRNFYLTRWVWPAWHEAQAVAEWREIFSVLGLVKM